MFKKNKSGVVVITVEQSDQDSVHRQSNLQDISQFQGSFESHVFTPATTNATDKFYYAYPYYFYYFFHAAFFLCLVPFWVEFKDKTKTMKLVTYKFQRIFCAIVHVGIFVITVLMLRLSVVRPIKDHSDKAFLVVKNACFVAFVVAFSRVVWSKQIKNLLEQPLPKITRKVGFKYNLHFVRSSR